MDSNENKPVTYECTSGDHDSCAGTFELSFSTVKCNCDCHDTMPECTDCGVNVNQKYSVINEDGYPERVPARYCPHCGGEVDRGGLENNNG